MYVWDVFNTIICSTNDILKINIKLPPTQKYMTSFSANWILQSYDIMDEKTFEFVGLFIIYCIVLFQWYWLLFVFSHEINMPFFTFLLSVFPLSTLSNVCCVHCIHFIGNQVHWNFSILETVKSLWAKDNLRN